VHGRQFRHFAGADEHGLLAGHLTEDALGQLHGGVADGHGAGADARGRAHHLGHGKSLVAQSVDDDSGGLGRHGVAIGGLELPEDLRFAEDQGIEPGGHGEKVFHRLQPAVGVEVRGQFRLVLAADLGPGRQHLGGRIAPGRVDHHHLHPVAGGQDQGLAESGRTMGQHIAEPRFGAQGESLPDIDPGGLMVEPEQGDLMLHRYIAKNCDGLAQKS